MWWTWSWSKKRGYEVRREYWGVSIGTGVPGLRVSSLYSVLLLLASNHHHHLVCPVRVNVRQLYGRRCPGHFLTEVLEPRRLSFPPTAVLWSRVPVISGVVVLEIGMTETKDTSWVISGAGERGTIGIDASPAMGGVLGVGVRSCFFSILA